MLLKYTLLSFGLLCFSSVRSQTNTQQNQPKQIFTYVEQMPTPPFDIPEYLGSNIHYPDTARKYNIQGRVIIKFIVTETGAIDSARINRGIGGGCDEEALRVVQNMPRWKPGYQNGKAVRVYFTLPIVFKLED